MDYRPAAFQSICARLERCSAEALEPLIELAVEIAREGREGRRIGTLFTFGDADAVLRHSRPLILDPLAGHPPERLHVADANLRGTIKELAQLDGAFVVTGEGRFVAACRYLDADTLHLDLPLGLGSRHLAAASISRATGAVGIVVSESGSVRVFDGGRMRAQILPELWLLGRRIQEVRGGRVEHVHDLAVLMPE